MSRPQAESWSQQSIEDVIRAEIGPHQKMELAVPYLARLFAGLWQAREANLARIDRHTEELRVLESRLARVEQRRKGDE